jgi:hypothetical protein
VVPAKGWTVTVTGAELDADRTMARANGLVRPGKGQRYVAVALSVARTADTPGSLVGEARFSLLTTSKATVGPLLINPLPDRLDGWVQVQPGGTQTGRLAFEVPEAEAGQVVLLVEPLWTRDRNEDQRFLSLR